MTPVPQVTETLVAVQEGLRSDASELAPLVYDELRRLAAKALARERHDHTLEPTALVHEAYVALARADGVDWRGRTHFRAVAARCIRRLLIDHARRRRADRRDGGVRLTLDAERPEAAERSIDPLELEDALVALARVSPTGAQVVELRFFGGLTEEETALALGIGARSVRREWATARAWLRRHMESVWGLGGS